MTNADKFKSIFGLYATELWAKPEKDFLEWLNADNELFGNSEQLESDHVADPGNMVGDLISRQAAIDAYITNCPYFLGKNTIDRSVYGTHIGECSLEYHYKKICPSPKCLCAERLELKDE